MAAPVRHAHQAQLREPERIPRTERADPDHTGLYAELAGGEERARAPVVSDPAAVRLARHARNVQPDGWNEKWSDFRPEGKGHAHACVQGNLSGAEQTWNRHDREIEARALWNEACTGDADGSRMTLGPAADLHPSDERADDPAFTRRRRGGLRTREVRARHEEKRDEHRSGQSTRLYR